MMQRVIIVGSHAPRLSVALNVFSSAPIVAALQTLHNIHPRPPQLQRTERRSFLRAASQIANS